MSDEPVEEHTDGEGCPHEGHGHINPEMLEHILEATRTATCINNLFVMFVPNPARFILTTQHADGSLHTLGYIPADFMLDTSMGLIRAVQTMMLGYTGGPGPVHLDDLPLSEPTQVGPFRVI